MAKQPAQGTHEAVLAEEIPVIRAAILRFLLTGLVVLLVVAVPVSFWVRAVSREIAEADVLTLTQRLADYAVSPTLAHDLHQGNPEALKQIEERLSPWISDDAIVRIKIWAADGTILFSDVTSLIGQKFELEPWAAQLLAGSPGTISLGEQHDEENTFESSSGDLVEVYVLSSADANMPLLFEVYYDDSVVRKPQRNILLGMIPVLLLSMAILQGAQLIPGIRLARQVQKRQRERRAMLQAALAAGERERRRLAADLHDDILQDLAGIAYALDPAADSGPDPGSILRNSIGKLRMLTSELYSTPVSAAELPGALSVLIERIRSQNIRTIVSIEEPVPLDDRAATMCYRIAREAVTNIIKYANARNVELCLTKNPTSLELRVSDDGKGYDPDAEVGPEHMGLRLMKDQSETVGASLHLSSEPGRGSTVRLLFPLAAPSQHNATTNDLV